MTYLSICSGIEAASVAWHPLGWQACGFSEIAPFQDALLKHHYPTIPNFGDMTKHHEWPRSLRPDLIVGGTPCQAFSVSGLRKGLADPRGNLTLLFLGLLERYLPRWVVWENVPGVLSDETGAFGAFLGGLAELGYGFAYRVLDAQFVRVDSHPGAVPQRRRRVFVVGYLGDWRPPAAILFEPQSLRGNPPPRREAGQIAAPTLDVRARRSGETAFHTSGGLVASQSVGFSCGPSGGEFIECCPTLDTRCKDGPIRNQLGAGVMTPIPFDTTQITSATNRSQPAPGNPCHPLASSAHPPAIAFSGRNPGDFEAGHLCVTENWTVRRLTPRECERLQGFPDDYTLIPYGRNGRDAADGPRYAAIGNSMAVNVMSWIGQRIAALEAHLSPKH